MQALTEDNMPSRKRPQADKAALQHWLLNEKPRLTAAQPDELQHLKNALAECRNGREHWVNKAQDLIRAMQRADELLKQFRMTYISPPSDQLVEIHECIRAALERAGEQVSHE